MDKNSRKIGKILGTGIGTLILAAFMIIPSSISANEAEKDSAGEEISIQSSVAAMSPSYQDLIESDDRADWTVTWSLSNGPYNIYFSADTGLPYYRKQVANAGVQSARIYHHYNSGPELYYPRVRIQNAINDAAIGNATVYRLP